MTIYNGTTRVGKHNVTSTSGTIKVHGNDGNTLTGSKIYATGNSNNINGRIWFKNDLKVWGKSNRITGGKQDDSIYANGMLNRLTGGGGADKFTVLSGVASPYMDAVISDFDKDDKLFLRGSSGEVLKNVTQRTLGKRGVMVSGKDTVTGIFVSAYLEGVQSAAFNAKGGFWYTNAKGKKATAQDPSLAFDNTGGDALNPAELSRRLAQMKASMAGSADTSAGSLGRPLPLNNNPALMSLAAAY